MKILQSYYVWLPLTMSWLYNQVRYLPDEVESHILCDRRENREAFDLPEISTLFEHNSLYANFNFLLRKTGWSRFSPFLRGYLKSGNFDLIHAHFGNMGWEMMPAARPENLPLITTFYGLDVNYLPLQRPVWKSRYRRLFDYSSLILCEGPHMKNAVVELGCPADKVLVHHLGVETEKLPFKVREPGNGPVKILIAGSFREKKGISYALKALQKVAGRHDISVTVIGDRLQEDRSNPEADEIFRLMQSEELKECTRHMGFQPHHRLIEEALDHHIFLSPSVTSGDGDTEGGVPVSIIEMTATGMPVVATTHCDIPNVIHHNVNGMLAGERNTDQLAITLDFLIRQPEKWKGLGENGRKLAETHFNAGKRGQRLAEIYSAVISGTTLPEDQNAVIG